MAPRLHASPRGGLRSRRGVSLIEMMVVLTILSFMILAVARLLDAGQKQQHLAQNHSRVQADLRAGLQRATFGIRHAYAVLGASSASQLFIDTPLQSGGQGTVRYYLRTANGRSDLYAHQTGTAAPGVLLIEGVQSLSFRYLQTIGTVRSDVSGTPAVATEVELTVQAQRRTWHANSPAARINAAVTVLVSLRNKVAPH